MNEDILNKIKSKLEKFVTVEFIDIISDLSKWIYQKNNAPYTYVFRYVIDDYYKFKKEDERKYGLSMNLYYGICDDQDNIVRNIIIMDISFINGWKRKESAFLIVDDPKHVGPRYENNIGLDTIKWYIPDASEYECTILYAKIMDFAQTYLPEIYGEDIMTKPAI